MLLAYDSLEEVERIDGLLQDYDAVLAAVRPREDAEHLNREYGRVVEALRYNPDAPQPSDWRQEDVMAAAQEIMKRFKGRKTNPPMS